MTKKIQIKVRKSWRINPKTRIKESNKRYRRTKAKSNLKRRLKKGLQIE